MLWIDQAILYNCLGPESETDAKEPLKHTLRTLGIHTATQLTVVHRYTDKGREGLEKAISVDTLSVLIEAIGLEPNFELVWAWRLPQYGNLASPPP
jgi:hypothetical protein